MHLLQGMSVFRKGLYFFVQCVFNVHGFSFTIKLKEHSDCKKKKAMSFGHDGTNHKSHDHFSNDIVSPVLGVFNMFDYIQYRTWGISGSLMVCH